MTSINKETMEYRELNRRLKFYIELSEEVLFGLSERRDLLLLKEANSWNKLVNMCLGRDRKNNLLIYNGGLLIFKIVSKAEYDNLSRNYKMAKPSIIISRLTGMVDFYTHLENITDLDIITDYLKRTTFDSDKGKWFVMTEDKDPDPICSEDDIFLSSLFENRDGLDNARGKFKELTIEEYLKFYKDGKIKNCN